MEINNLRKRKKQKVESRNVKVEVKIFPFKIFPDLLQKIGPNWSGLD
jgi:hypothetical protein